MRKLSVTILFLLFLIDISFSLDTMSTKYYPLRVGNSWTYNYYNYYPPAFYRFKRIITGTVILNSHLYYTLYNTQYFSYSNLRIDSSNGRVLIYSTSNCSWLNNEILADSLESKKFDSCKASCDSSHFTKCTDTSMTTIFGLSKPSKHFNHDYFEFCDDRIYVKDFGITYIFGCGGNSNSSSTLIGCVLDSVVYGDTSLTGINPISTVIPDEFKLSQNYPNPFNPTTKIKFSIPTPLHPPFSQRGEGVAGGFVSLIIYDILSREIATLVNESLTPGTYEVEWDGSNYPSGVYFYKLITDSFSETKRMVLIK